MQFLNNTVANQIYALKAYEEPIKKTIIHYTTTEVLDILLDKCTFRASNVFYLNDSMEYKEGIKRLQKRIEGDTSKHILDDIKDENGSGKISRGIFSISFSQEVDSLYQWITYAKEAGVAIELDDNLIMDLKECLWYGIESYDENNDKNKCCDDLLYISLRLAMNPVNYKFDENTSLRIDEMKTDINEKYMWYASFFKQKGFKAENEIRLSVFATENGKTQGEIKYFPMGGKGVLRPYLNVTFGYRRKKCKKKLFVPCLPLKSVMVGPSRNQQLAFDSVVHRIKYGKINVYKYVENKELLKKAFRNYFEEIITWLNEKECLSDGINCSQGNILSGNLIDEVVTDVATIASVKNKVLTLKKTDGNNIDVKELIERILSDWINDNKDYLLSIKCESGNNLYSENYLQGGERKDYLDNVVKKINSDFYFSKEGILVKKSKIPYIF